MADITRDHINHDRGISRRALVKGGLSVAAGAVATALAARAGSAAVTPMDVARVQPSASETPVVTTPETPVAAPTTSIWGSTTTSSTWTSTTTTTPTSTTGASAPSFWSPTSSTKP